MKIAFYKWKGDWLDSLIRWFTGQQYTHCELIFPTWEAFSSSERDGWVRFKKIEFRKENWDIIDYYVWKDEVNKLYNKAKLECWKKYDFKWILFSIIFKYNVHSKDKWFCSEICWSLLWVNNSNTLTPWDLFENINN